MRAGMIPALMPLLWRRADAVQALGRTGAKAIIASSRVGSFDHCDLAMHLAANLFGIRHVCGFGTKLADGVVPLDDLFLMEPSALAPDILREGNPAAHVAAITFEITPHGLIAVPRDHLQLISGGLAVLLEGRIGVETSILACCSLNSFAGLAHTVMPWLMTGGLLSLHHAFDPRAFLAQCGVERCSTVILPGAMVRQMADAGLLAHADLKSVLAVWPAPERLALGAAWRHDSAALIDVQVFGETALIAARREAEGLPEAIAYGTVQAPRGSAGAVTVAETARTEAGTFAVRGPMVPSHAFPPGVERSGAAHFHTDDAGFVDTGYGCRIDDDAGTLTLTGPPAGMVNVGGYRFRQRELVDQVKTADIDATIGALPDAILGHRLSGNAADSPDVEATLSAMGANPLITGAFRGRPVLDAA